MKNSFLRTILFLSTLVLSAGLPVSAQSYAVYKTDGTLLRFPCTEVDSIVFCPAMEIWENGHEAVDLDLPSGTKWATCNVGASSPEEYGGYYAWGEIEEKSSYDWSTYKHCDGSKGTCHSLGDDIAGTEYDVAHVKWGGGWKMPTRMQLEELKNEDYCTWTWTTRHGVDGENVNGYEVTSKTNGNKIFLPAAGWRGGTSLNRKGIHGYYWGSSINSVNRDSDWAGNLIFRGGTILRSPSTERYYGQSVRPVLE